MMSFRRAEDHTYIAQLLGRMVRTPLARRIEKDAALNDVHLFLPHFDTQAVQTVVAALQDQEHAPPAEAGSSRELVVLARRPGSEAIFQALDGLVTYRVNAARAQSPLRRYMAMVLHLNRDRIDEGAWEAAQLQVVGWMRELVETMRSTGTFGPAVRAVTQVALQTLALQGGTGLTEHESDYLIAASTTDIERLFEEAGRAFSHGLHVDYWRMRGARDSLATKVETIILARDAALMSTLEKKAEVAFEALYERHKRTIHGLREHRRSVYDKLRLATAKPVDLAWRLPESIDFRRLPDAPLRDRHLYIDADGRFRAELGTWEAGVLAEELADPSVVGWLRNVDRKPWSLEIPYESGGEVRSMFPDLVVVRLTLDGYVVDILEPHNPSLADNFEKAVGLSKFAERHSGLFGRIQLIRQQTSAGDEHFVRLEINRMATIKKLSTVTSNPALDALFASAT
jgi:type III restriction enzyme